MKRFVRRLIIFSLTVLVTAGFLTAIAAVTYQEIEFYAVFVDDDFLGFTTQEGLTDDAVEQYLLVHQLRTGFQVSIEQDVRSELRQAYEPPTMTSPASLRRNIQDRLSIITHATGLVVKGDVIGVVANEREAAAIISEIEAEHAEARQNDDRVEVLSVEIVEDIELVRMPADPDSIADPDYVKEILLRGTDKTVLHEVQGGDTAWGIARAAGLSVSDLEKANPGVNISRIHPGDELELVVADPYITLRTEETSWYMRHIPHRVETRRDPNLWPWQRRVLQGGRPGEVRVTVRIEREGGREVAREILSEEHVSDPVTHIVVQGTRTVPQYGSGQFILPAVGTLTSGFGWRASGFHHGIDLAMPIGTPVKAADGGMVTFAGRSGNYGIMIRIDHGEGEYVTLYAHLNRLAVSTGDVVKQGQVIGYSGSTGRSTGPHLHFEIHHNGVPQNPIRFFTD